VSDRQVTMDAISVAAPVFDAAGAVVAALSLVVGVDRAADGMGLSPRVGIPVHRSRSDTLTSWSGITPADALGPAVRTAARGISRASRAGQAAGRPRTAGGADVRSDWPKVKPADAKRLRQARISRYEGRATVTATYQGQHVDGYTYVESFPVA